MIIIIEGADGSGKTTLANKLSAQTGYPLIHMSQPKDAVEEQRMFIEYKDLICQNKNIILDRCWYSEMAYGPLMRGRSAISYPMMFALEGILSRKGALLIYCKTDPKKQFDNARKRGEDFITTYDTFQAIYEMFEEIMGVPHSIPVVTYDYKSLY